MGCFGWSPGSGQHTFRGWLTWGSQGKPPGLGVPTGLTPRPGWALSHVAGAPAGSVGLFQGSGRKHGLGWPGSGYRAQWPGQVWRLDRTWPIELGSLREDSGGGWLWAASLRHPLAFPLLMRINEMLPLLVLRSEDAGPFVLAWAPCCCQTRSAATRTPSWAACLCSLWAHRCPAASQWTLQALFAPKGSCFPSIFKQTPQR